MKGLLSTAVAAAITLVAFEGLADDVNHDGYETILFPIALAGVVGDRIPGAFRTVWQGEVWVRNTSPSTIFLQPKSPCPFENCVSPVEPSYVGRLALGIAPSGMRGLVIEPPADAASALTFSNRLFETTRHAQPQVFELPVVREGEFFKGAEDFLGLPGGTNVRAMLRVYDPRRVSGTAVTVQLIDSTGKVLGETTVSTTFSNATPVDVIEPGFAALDVNATFPVVTTLGRYHLRVTPVTTGREYWAMASVTDNDTQQVLIVTAQ